LILVKNTPNKGVFFLRVFGGKARNYIFKNAENLIKNLVENSFLKMQKF
jgi:hypothetical protein